MSITVGCEVRIKYNEHYHSPKKYKVTEFVGDRAHLVTEYNKSVGYWRLTDLKKV